MVYQKNVMAPAGSLGSMGSATNLRKVRITQIDKARNIAWCDDGSGTKALINVPWNIQRAQGELPREGQLWFIVKEFGGWTFAGVTDYFPVQGIYTFKAGQNSAQIHFRRPENDNKYGIVLSATWGTNIWTSNYTTDTFDVHTSVNAPGITPVAWRLVR